MNDKRMRLGAVLTATGQHVVAWRHRDVPTDVGTNLAAYITAAQTAERGRFDMMFVADELAFGSVISTVVVIRRVQPISSRSRCFQRLLPIPAGLVWLRS